MRKKTKKMLWRVAIMASAATACLVLLGMLVIQASFSNAGNYGQANISSDFGLIDGEQWVQNSQGHWVAKENANSNSLKGDMSSFMVLGDSISFGYMVGYVDEATGTQIPSVDPRLVPHAWPKLVADQAGVEMNLPFTQALSDNLAVPGYALWDMFKNYTQLAGENPVTQYVMGLYYYMTGDNTPVGYVLASDASTVGVMIGNNDILGAATRANLALATPVPLFDQMYSNLVYQLASDPERSVVVATIPDVTSIPFLVPAEEFAAAIGAPLPAYIPAVNEDGTPYTVKSTDYVTLAGYQVLGAGLPALTKCSNTTYTCNGQVLTADEVSAISAHTDEFNNAIRSIAAQYNNVAVMNFDEIFDNIKEKGIVIQGKRYTADYLGGLFSADGVHPTMLGHAVLANEIIKTLNTNFATGIQPLVLNDFAANEQLAGAALTPPASLKAQEFVKSSKMLNGELEM